MKQIKWDVTLSGFANRKYDCLRFRKSNNLEDKIISSGNLEMVHVRMGIIRELSEKR